MHCSESMDLGQYGRYRGGIDDFEDLTQVMVLPVPFA